MDKKTKPKWKQIYKIKSKLIVKILKTFKYKSKNYKKL